MKITYFFGLIFLVFSCSVDTNDTHLVGKEIISNRTDTPPDMLETRMQWTSFLTALVLSQDPLAREEFNGFFFSTNNVIPLKDIFKPSSIAPNFKASFLDRLDWYSLIICQIGKPEPGPVPPSMMQDPTCASEFLQYIYNDNCLEFYFPEGLILDPVLPITSTAHPLTQADSNYGFKRYEKVSGIPKVSEVTVDPSYLTNNKDIIVVRPINSSFNCDYSEYGVPNFNTFLGE